MADWDLQPGEHTTRAEMAKRFGGNPQAGIASSARTPNVLIYSDKDEAGAYGYDFDGWADRDTVFHYTGEGPIGDQLLSRGNRAIVEHKTARRSLRVFVAEGVQPGTVRTKRQLYLGEFAVDEDRPYFTTEAPDQDGNLRSVFVFRLRPVGNPLIRAEDRAETSPPIAGTQVVEVEVDVTVDETEVEENSTLEYLRAGTEPLSARRREAELVAKYKTYLEVKGHIVKSRLIRPVGVLTPLHVDLYDNSARELVEAKGRTTRDSIRYAIGQVLDYGRHVDHVSLAILVPSRPSDDLCDLMTSLNISCIYQDPDTGFQRISP